MFMKKVGMILLQKMGQRLSPNRGITGHMTSNSLHSTWPPSYMQAMRPNAARMASLRT
jgi:hypothetical protein